jgi:hypothetical protein
MSAERVDQEGMHREEVCINRVRTERKRKMSEVNPENRTADASHE